MTRYFKVKTGFSAEDMISIEEKSLEAAIKAQLTGGLLVLPTGTVRGNNIISITEDWHKAMDYNQGYELKAEDFAHIKSKLGNTYEGAIAGAVAKVEASLSGNSKLLG